MSYGDRARAVTKVADSEAEQRTETTLAKLPAREWTVLSDIDSKHWVDHVVVGPGGVFLIASRKPDGPGARMKDGVLLVRKGGDARSYRRGVGINRDVLHSARALSREIRIRTGRGPEVQPVVVLWCEFPERVAESRQIAFVQGRSLLAWIQSRPRTLDMPGCEQIIDAINSLPRDGRLRTHLHLPHRAL